MKFKELGSIVEKGHYSERLRCETRLNHLDEIYDVGKLLCF